MKFSLQTKSIPTERIQSLPHNVRRMLFEYGIESEFVCKILLQAQGAIPKKYAVDRY